MKRQADRIQLKFICIDTMRIDVHHPEGRIEFIILPEQRVVQKPDLNCRLCLQIILAFIEHIEAPAQILHGPFRPVFMINDLHLDINDRIIVEVHFNVKNISFLCYRFTWRYRILNNEAPDF